MSTWMSREDTAKLEELKTYFKTRNKTKEYAAHSSKVHSVGWSCDGRRLASGSFDKTVTIFSLDRDRLVSILVISYILLNNWTYSVKFTQITIIIFWPQGVRHENQELLQGT